MRRQSARIPLFHRRRFADHVIILCVRWCLRFKLSYRQMAEIAWDYIEVGGGWMYLYHAIDELGRTVASHLSRDMTAAKAFFRKALRQDG
jgi:putative transposase